MGSMVGEHHVWLTGWLCLILTSISMAAQPWGPPFVQKLAMDVIDPASDLPELSSIETFSHLAQSIDGEIYATFEANPVRLGILVLDGTSLKVKTVRWFDEIKSGQDLNWCGLVSLNDKGIIALCFERRMSKDTDLIRGYAVSSLPGEENHWSVKQMSLPERPSAVTHLRRGGILAGLTEPSNWFFRYDLKAGNVDIHRVVFDFVPYRYPHGRCLYLAPGGQLYGSYKGRLFSYDPESSFFAYLGMLPCQYGHLSEVALTAMAGDGKNMLVGGTNGNGYLFTVNLNTLEVRSWGRPTDGTEIRNLVYAGESGFWGIAVTPGQSCRLFHFQPNKRRLVDLGIPAGVLSQSGRTWAWHAFQIADMLVLNDGRILLAESAKQAKLLIFDPNRRQK